MATNNKPANTLRCGNIKATIWENTNEKGLFTQRPSPTRSRISPGRGATELRLVSVTLRPCAPSRVMPKSGLPLMS